MPDFVKVRSKETKNEFLVDRSNLNDTLTVVDETPDTSPNKPASSGKKED